MVANGPVGRLSGVDWVRSPELEDLLLVSFVVKEAQWFHRVVDDHVFEPPHLAHALHPASNVSQLLTHARLVVGLILIADV